MKIIFQILLAIFVFFNLLNSANSFPKENQTTAWDTVVAKIKIIDSGKQADSIKAVLIHQVFNEYEIRLEDYHNFYREFFIKSPEKQVEFLKQVEKIIQTHLKEFLVPDPKKDPRRNTK